MIIKPKYYGPAIPSTYAITMTAAASGSNGITVADDNDIDFGTGDFAIAETFAYQQGVAATKAEENLLLQSQAFDNASWGNNAAAIVRTANTGVAPDGSTTADSWKGDGTSALHYSGQLITLVSAPVSRLSIYAKADGVNFIQIFAVGGSGYANFDITAGAGVVGTAAAPFSDLTIQDAGGGWYRCTCLITSSAHNNIYIALSNSATAVRAAASFATSNGVFLWGAQLEQRSSVTAYTPTTTATITKNVYWLALKYQDGNNYWGYRISSTGLLEFIAAVSGLVKINASSTTALTSANGQIIEAVFTCSRETAGAAGSGKFYVDGNQFGTSVSIAAATPASISNTGSLYLMGSDAVRNLSNLVRAIIMNFAPTAAEVLDLCTNGIPASWKWGSQTALYTSNFGTDTDGFTPSFGTAAGNIDGIDGVDNVLRYTATSTGAGRRVQKSLGFTQGLQYSLTISVNFPVGNTSADSFILCNESGVALASTTFAQNVTKGAWASYRFEFVAAVTALTLRIYTGATASTTASTDSGDIMYVVGIEQKRIGATFAALPETIPTSGALAWTDSSGNTGGGTLPAAGATKVTIRK